MEAVDERLLRDTFESEEAAQRDPEPEEPNEIFEVEEVAQIVPEPMQMNKILSLRKLLR